MQQTGPLRAALTRRGRVALAVIGIAALAAFVPLRLVLGLAMPDTVTARSVEGTVWGGRLADLQAGPLPLGTVRAGLRILPLFIGRAEFGVEREGAIPFAARIAATGSTFRLSHASGAVMVPDGLGGLPVSAVNFGDLSVDMADGRCVHADGSLGLTIAPLGALLPDPIVLNGKARCANNQLVVPMQGPGGMERLTLRIEADGRWQADMTLAGLPPEVSAPLLQSGFAARPDGIGLRTSGRF